VIVTSGDRHKKDVLISNFAPQDAEGNYVDEIGHKIIFLCPKYVNKNTPEPLKSWLTLINDSLDGKIEESHYQLAEILKVLSHIEQNEVSPQEKARMIDEYSFDKIKRLEYEKGEHKGVEQGIEQGIEQEKIKIALTMFSAGLDHHTIAKLTHIDEALLLKLADQ
jgi:predicted transposase/invertase (TIGR01784 family)